MTALLFVLPTIIAALQTDAALSAVRDSVRQLAGEVVDAEAALPIGDARIVARGGVAWSDARGRFAIRARGGDTLHVSRFGYAPYRLVLSPGNGSVLRIALHRQVATLRTVQVREQRDGARTDATVRTAAAARRAGATSATDLVASLPFVATRSAGSRTGFSVRGSRAEQVIILLDGLPLNDPATGVADPGDIPLAAISTASVAAGSAVAQFGSGASGGVIALNSSDRRLLSVSGGAYGRRGAEGAWSARSRIGAVRAGAAWSQARDDFPFRNVAAAPPADTIERRMNNDVARRTVFASVLSSRAHLLVLASETERGLVGPMNVRAFDRDRGRTRRVLGRAAAAPRGWELVGGARVLETAYADAARPAAGFRVTARSFDAEVARSAGPVRLRAGGGVDLVAGHALRPPPRPRSFVSAAGVRRLPRALEAHLAVRGDAVRGAGVAWTPSLTVRRDGPVTVVARAARAFRVPTFFDLYLASPQRIIARPLAPERVSHDLELRALTRHGRRGMNLRAELSVFDRRTRDAIVWFPGNVGWSPTNVPVERARGAEVQGSAERHGLEASLWGGVYGTRLWDGFMEMRTPYVPYRSGGASLSARRGRLTLASEMRLVGRRPFVNGPSHPDLELPGAALANASLAYRVRVRGAALSLHLSGDNLGGARWESVRRYPTPGRTFAAGITLEP